MSIIGTDSWLLPRAIEVESFQLAQGQRHDVIIDFRDAPDEVYLENILVQTDGRGAKEVDPTKERDLLLKFEVSGANSSEPRCVEGTVIRGFAGIDPGGQFSFHRQEEIVGTRSFEFERSLGRVDHQQPLLQPKARGRGAGAGQRGGALDLRERRRRLVAPDPHASRGLPDQDRQRQAAPARAPVQQRSRRSRRRLHGGGVHQVPHLHRAVRLSLPRHRARGHAHDGDHRSDARTGRQERRHRSPHPPLDGETRINLGHLGRRSRLHRARRGAKDLLRRRGRHEDAGGPRRRVSRLQVRHEIAGGTGEDQHDAGPPSLGAACRRRCSASRPLSRRVPCQRSSASGTSSAARAASSRTSSPTSCSTPSTASRCTSTGIW